MVESWIYENNLRPFLCMAFEFVGYKFDEADWQAVEFGIRETDAEQDKWFSYDLESEPEMFLAIAHDDNSSVIFVKAKSTSEIETKIGVLLEVVRSYHLSSAH